MINNSANAARTGLRSRRAVGSRRLDGAVASGQVPWPWVSDASPRWMVPRSLGMTPTISLSPGISSCAGACAGHGQRGTLPTVAPRPAGPAELTGPAGELTRPAGEPATPAGDFWPARGWNFWPASGGLTRQGAAGQEHVDSVEGRPTPECPLTRRRDPGTPCTR